VQEVAGGNLFVKPRKNVAKLLFLPKKNPEHPCVMHCRTPVGQMIIFGKDPAGGNKLVI
jgi:hypothetical protein